MRGLLVVVLASGCSLINSWEYPDHYLDSGMDGGTDGAMDASPDAPPGDAPTDVPSDAPPGDAMPDTGPVVDMCSSDPEMIDNDEDGLVGCDDPDCFDRPECCGETGREVIGGDLMTGWPTTTGDWDIGWNSLPGAGAYPDVGDGEDGNRIEDWVSRGAIPAAVQAEDCLGLALGARVRVQFERPMDPTTDLAAYSSLVLTPEQEFQENQEEGLFAELAIRVSGATGAVTVSNAEQIIASERQLVIEPGHTVQMTVSASPGARDGEARVIIKVDYRFIDWPASAPTPDPQGGPLVEYDGLRLDQLITTGRCEAVPGLFVALQGNGEGPYVLDEFVAEELACPNPNQFGRSTDPRLTAEDLGFDPQAMMTDEWASEQLREPSIAVAGSAMNPRWHVLAEGSNDPDVTDIARVGYAVGHAASSNWNTTPWSDTSSTPKIGAAPPSCVGSSCGTRAIREPFFLLTTSGAVVAWAQEAEAGDDSSFVLGIAELGTSHSERVDPESEGSILDLATLNEESSCGSLRDPALVSRGTSEYWLFYTCVPDGAPSRQNGGEIHVRALSGAFAPLPREDGSPQIVLTPEMLNVDGVYGPEPVADEEGEIVNVRLWYRTWSRSAETINLAIKRVEDFEMPTADMGSFTPFDANPVLTINDPVFPDCVGCRFEGFAVTRTKDVGRLRFLVARQLPTGATYRYELIPLEQAFSPSAIR